MPPLWTAAVFAGGLWLFIIAVMGAAQGANSQRRELEQAGEHTKLRILVRRDRAVLFWTGAIIAGIALALLALAYSDWQ